MSFGRSHAACHQRRSPGATGLVRGFFQTDMGNTEDSNRHIMFIKGLVSSGKPGVTMVETEHGFAEIQHSWILLVHGQEADQVSKHLYHSLAVLEFTPFGHRNVFLTVFSLSLFFFLFHLHQQQHLIASRLSSTFSHSFLSSRSLHSLHTYVFEFGASVRLDPVSPAPQAQVGFLQLSHIIRL